ncbi:AmpG family muropeptide MFS transporter [Sphingomonas sp. G-3-2-10]|jgi:PAT family beta-lactamase induction signal transducer AmpG|nr:permease [Sphingomonas sp. G-3-2-10]NML05229.1 AmpG family muropeptide MFS transporter [Sphingomonas sp. G-3-2-10]
MALYVLLGFSAGLPFYMFSTILSARLTDHGVALTIIGFFAWVQLLPTFKFLWAPLLEKYDVPGFARFWGKRRGWIMLSQLGIVTSMAAMTLTASDASLPVTALFAVLLAFWTTTLEVAADAWRIELAPTQEEQGPIAASNLWGYRTAMVAAGSGALIFADASGSFAGTLRGFGIEPSWTSSYLLITLAAAIPLPILASLPAQPSREGGTGTGGRGVALVTGLGASAAILLAIGLGTALVGWLVLGAASGIGVDAKTNVTPWVLGISALPFLAMAIALPRIRTAGPNSPLRTSTAIGPYVDFFWRYGTLAITLMAFVSIYRMGDVLALNLSKPMILGLGYTKTEIGRADGIIALVSSIVGVGLGGWMVTRWPSAITLTIGAIFAAIGNFGFVWLAHMPHDEMTLYIATALDQFGNGMAGAVFVVYLSMLCSPRYPGAQYAFLSGFAFLLSRLLAGAGGTIVGQLDKMPWLKALNASGFDAFFFASGAISLAALLFLPLIARARARPYEEAA